jgi:hypothetical protein
MGLKTLNSFMQMGQVHSMSIFTPLFLPSAAHRLPRRRPNLPRSKTTIRNVVDRNQLFSEVVSFKKAGDWKSLWPGL